MADIKRTTDISHSVNAFSVIALILLIREGQSYTVIQAIEIGQKKVIFLV